jgi:hypothetical protein
MQPGGEHVDEHLVLVGRDRRRELLVARSGVERRDNSGVHAGLPDHESKAIPRGV